MSGDKQGQVTYSILIKYVIRLIKPCKLLLITYILCSLFLGVLIAFSTQIRTFFFDNILDENNSKQTVLLLLFVNLLVVFVIQYALPMIQNIVEERMQIHIFCEIESRIGEKKCKIPWEYFEQQDINDNLEIIKDAWEKMWELIKGFVQILSLLVSMLGMFYIMTQLGLVYCVLLGLLFIPVAYFSISAARIYYDTWQRTASLRRFCDYQRDILMNKEFSTERILFQYTPFILKRWEKDYEDVRTLSIKEELKGSKRMQLSGLIFCLYIIILLFILYFRVRAGVTSLGFAIALISIFPGLMNKTIVSLSNEINTLIKSLYAVWTIISFEELEQEDGIFNPPDRDINFSQIVFNNVSFKYPNTKKWVLKDVNMCFEKGKHYAIVGENGAGKSTIIKLLLRLYRATEGEILIDGVNINEIAREKITGLIAALFQDHQRYLTDIIENIAIGNINDFENISRIEESAKQVGIHNLIKSMPNGYKTKLGAVQQGGVDLSGGEWQKLAVARLINSACLIKILDEPTSAMDPIFEYSLYQDFNKIMKNTTTISISHRLASCRNVDLIYVLKDGQIVECGNHKLLMDNKNLYYKMYSTQKEMYK